MIVVAMAQDECIDRGRVDPQQLNVVVERFRCEAEIHQNMTPVVSALGFGMHRQTKLADEGLARWFATTNTPAKPLNLDVAGLRAGRDLIAVDDDADRDTVDL